MDSNIKFSSGLHVFGNTLDRFVGGGYKEDKSLEELFESASKVKELSGVELIGGWHINEENVDRIKELKNKYNLEIVFIGPDLWTQKRWKNGSFASNDKKIRREAIEVLKKTMDIAAEVNCNLLDVWFAHDGYDYSFQADFIKAWELIIDGLKECADYRKDVNLGIEYKIKEPRTHLFIGTIGKTLLLLEKVNCDNVGVILDVGHSLYGYENMAESAALCKFFGDKLYHLHLNDNYRYWDDDMMVASVHIPEYLELIYWLKRISYKGWYSLDIFPYREDGIGAANECIALLKSLINTVNSFDNKEIEKIINEADGVKSYALIRKILFK